MDTGVHLDDGVHIDGGPLAEAVVVGEGAGAPDDAAAVEDEQVPGRLHRQPRHLPEPNATRRRPPTHFLHACIDSSSIC